MVFGCCVSKPEDPVDIMPATAKGLAVEDACKPYDWTKGRSWKEEAAPLEHDQDWGNCIVPEQDGEKVTPGAPKGGADLDMKTDEDAAAAEASGGGWFSGATKGISMPSFPSMGSATPEKETQKRYRCLRFDRPDLARGNAWKGYAKATDESKFWFDYAMLKKIEIWGKANVQQWLTEIGHEELLKAFEAENVDGDVLICITEAELMEMFGLSKVGARAMYRKIQRLIGSRIEVAVKPTPVITLCSASHAITHKDDMEEKTDSSPALQDGLPPLETVGDTLAVVRTSSDEGQQFTDTIPGEQDALAAAKLMSGGEVHADGES